MERLCRILDFTTGNGHHDHDSRFYRILSSQPQRTNLPKNPMTEPGVFGKKKIQFGNLAMNILDTKTINLM